MSETKRFYWLKLQEDFFEDDTIDFIESQENGERYCLFYLKLCLKALKSEGKLIRYVGNMLIPYDEAGLAKLTRTDVDTVRCALALFDKIGLVSRLDTGEIFISQLNEMVGTETDKAKLMRQKRAKEKLIGNNVTPMLPECYTEKDIEKEKEIKREQEESCVPSYVPQPIKTDKETFQNFLNECFNLISEHNKSGKHKIPVSKNIMYFSQKEGRDLLELSRQYEVGEIRIAILNYLKVANMETWKSGFSFNAFCRNISEYIPEYFDITKYVEAPKNEEDIKAITESFAEKNMKEKWFDYAVFHHHRADWIKAGKPEGNDFIKWADKVYNEDIENGIKY